VYERKAFPVQTVIRPKQKNMILEDAGKLYGNNIKVGDAVTVLPSLTESKVTNIHFFINNLMKLRRFFDTIEYQCN
jgi:sulfate adenylyltransferase subunit 1